MDAALNDIIEDESQRLSGAISVCLCTFRRPQRLAAVLDDLLSQQSDVAQLLEIVVVDNDAQGSAEATVKAAAARATVPLHYLIEPQQNIAIARNRSVAHARGEWLAILDDDERAPTNWLDSLGAAALEYEADGVFGPVHHWPPDDAPEWFKRGRFLDRAAQVSGSTPPGNRLYTNNALIKKDVLCRIDGPFDPAFGISGGSDTIALSQVHATGARLVWCEDAGVTEDVDPNRVNVSWLLQRAARGGRDYALLVWRGHIPPLYGMRRAGLVIDTVVKGTAALLLCVVTLPAPKHLRVNAWRKLWAHWGRIRAFTGARFEEYRTYAGK